MDMGNIIRKAVRPVALNFRRLRISMSNRPASDLSYKQQRLLETGRYFGCATFVETGTFLGDTVAVMKFYFDSVLSVELSEELHQKNRERFKNCNHVMLWQGNSGALMPEMLGHAGNGRILFWLDAHYSGEGTAEGEGICPVMAELAAIAAIGRNDHCILIDDARCFENTPCYPTIGKLKETLLGINPAFHITVENDCIAALPPE